MERKRSIGILVSSVLLCGTSLAYQPFVNTQFPTIIQNITNDDFNVHYSICTFIAYGKGSVCSTVQTLFLPPQTSNYQNPIIANIDMMDEEAGVEIVSVTDLKTNFTQNYSYHECTTNYHNNGNSSHIGILTLSFVVNDPNIIICTPGVAKK